MTYRFDDVVANDCMLPPEETKPRPKFTDATTGTVVELVLEDSAHMRPARCRPVPQVPRTQLPQRHPPRCVHHRRVHVSQRSTSSKVHLRDPLALMEGSEEVEKLGMAKAYDVPPLVMNDIIDPETGEPAVITSAFPHASITARRKLGANYRYRC